MKYQPILVIHITKRKATMRVQYFDLASVYDITSSIFIMNMKMKISINVQCTMYKSPPDTSLELFVWCRRSACGKASRGCSRLISTLPLLPIPTSNSHFQFPLLTSFKVSSPWRTTTKPPLQNHHLLYRIFISLILDYNTIHTSLRGYRIRTGLSAKCPSPLAACDSTQFL